MSEGGLNDFSQSRTWLSGLSKYPASFGSSSAIRAEDAKAASAIPQSNRGFNVSPLPGRRNAARRLTSTESHGCRLLSHASPHAGPGFPKIPIIAWNRSREFARALTVRSLAAGRDNHTTFGQLWTNQRGCEGKRRASCVSWTWSRGRLFGSVPATLVPAIMLTASLKWLTCNAKDSRASQRSIVHFPGCPTQNISPYNQSVNSLCSCNVLLRTLTHLDEERLAS